MNYSYKKNSKVFFKKVDLFIKEKVFHLKYLHWDIKNLKNHFLMIVFFYPNVNLKTDQNFGFRYQVSKNSSILN